MAAPKGNKYAVGNPNSGRPRKYDPEVEAVELLKWCMTEEATVLREFAPLRGYPCCRLDDFCERSEVFRDAYAVAKSMVGVRREKILIENGSSVPFNRYATMYDEKLHKHERAEKEFDAKISADTQKTVAQDVLDKANAVLTQLEQMRQHRSIANIKVSEDHKS